MRIGRCVPDPLLGCACFRRVRFQALLLPKAGSKFYPFEWTPLYGGCPVSYQDVTPKLGAGWIETLGLNAELLKKVSAA